MEIEQKETHTEITLDNRFKLMFLRKKSLVSNVILRVNYGMYS